MERVFITGASSGIGAALAKAYAVVMQWQMALVGKIMRILPNRLYDTLAVKSGRKPRKNVM